MHLLRSESVPAEEMWEKRLPPERVLPFDRKDAWGSALVAKGSGSGLLREKRDNPEDGR